MAANKKITVEVTSNRKEYLKALEEIAETVLEQWGLEGSESAADLAPVDTGLLRNSITYAIAGSAPAKGTYTADSGGGSGSYSGQAQADKGGARHVYIGTNVEYAPYQELGTSKMMKAQPFLRPGIENIKDRFKEILESELKKNLAK